MTLTKYQQLCYRWLGDFGEQRANEHLKENLQSAHMNIRAGAYYSYVILTTIFVIVASLAVFTFLLFFFFPLIGIQLDFIVMLLFLVFPLFIGVIVYFIGLSLPGFRAKGRGKKIDVNLAYAVNFISAMASAGVTPTEIFKSLSKQEIYGEIGEEAAWIYRDVGFLGIDIVTAIKANIQRSPSKKFKEFLQGMVVTVTSGGSLKSYFMNKADQYMWENRQSQKQLLETLGIMAESYVTVAVAGILMLLIVIPLMMLISGSFNSFFLYMLIFIIVPIIHFGFAGIIKMMVSGA